MNAMARTFPSTDTPRQDQGDLATYDAHALIENGVQARIVLDGQVYLLRITRSGKLILTK